jgi:hypothetical protein
MPIKDLVKDLVVPSRKMQKAAGLVKSDTLIGLHFPHHFNPLLHFSQHLNRKHHT